MISLIDGDIVCFRAAFTAEEDELWVATSRTDSLINEILDATEADNYSIFLSGKDNFRYKIFPEYKANRIRAKRPKWEKEVKQHMVDHYGAVWTHGCEADDSLGVTQIMFGDNSIICTIDKDLDQIPGWHYNFVKKEKYYVTKDQGLRYFYYQLLVGDSADGIKGCKGIGKIKAERLLSEGSTADEWLAIVQEAYGNDEELEMNAKCLWIWQKSDDVWEWPVSETK